MYATGLRGNGLQENMVHQAKALEKVLMEELRDFGVTSLQDKAVQIFLKTAQKLLKQQKVNEAAHRYAALAIVLGEESPNVTLLAAQTYQKAGDTASAARWFLQAADDFTKHYPTKAVAALRRYTQLKPDDVTNPYRIYKMCGDEYLATESLLHGLSDEDKAGHRLVSSQLFEAFDKSNFNALLQGLSYRKLKDKEVLSQMGDQAQTMFIVISGKLSGYLTFKDKRTYLGDIGEDDICGETAYFTGGRRTAEIVTKGETEVFELPYALLDKFQGDFSSFKQKIEDKYKSRILVKQLALTTVFANVDVKRRDIVAQNMITVRVKAGDTLFKENESGIGLYVVRTGKLAVTIDVKGCETLVKTVETGGVFGEISILTNGKRTATVRAVSDATLMHLERQDYQTYFDQCPALQQTLQQLKQAQVKETLNLMKNSKAIDGDDTCALLLQNIWRDH
jgi:CRP-like cAMP-binding protein